jgi:hypothetical protein
MSFFDFAFHMFPYWCLGAAMGWAVWKSDYKDLLAFDKKTFGKFFVFMTVVSIYRYFMLRVLINHGYGSHLDAIKNLPVGATMFVGWEDMAHIAPLVLMRKMLGTKKWTWPIHALATLVVMISFMSGHIYQGVVPAMFISLYIPFAVNFAQRKGLGTLMVNHITYDFMTIMLIKMIVGF